MARYHNYRGRHGKARRQKAKFAFAIVLAIILTLYLCFFSDVNSALSTFFGNISQTLLQQDENKPDPDEPGEPDDPSEPTEPTEPDVPDEPDEPVETKPLRIARYAGDEALAAQVTAPVNALVIDLKQADGAISYLSKDPLVLSGEAVIPGAADWTAQIAQLKEQGVYLIGRISCFKDQAAPKVINSSILVRQGVSWLDGNMERWFNPYNQITWNYIAAIAKEAAQLGFDEILLDDAVFPTYGKTSLCNYAGMEDGRSKSECVAQFAAYIKEAVGDTAKVSLVVEAKVLDGSVSAEISGQAFDKNTIGVDYICPEASTPELLEAFLAGMTDKTKAKPIYKGDGAALTTAGAAAGVTEYILWES